MILIHTVEVGGLYEPLSTVWTGLSYEDAEAEAKRWKTEESASVAKVVVWDDHRRSFEWEV